MHPPTNTPPAPNARRTQGYGLDGYPKYSLANTGCKHFSTFDGPMNWGTAVISDYDWFLNYLPQFERCLDAGSYSVMCSCEDLNSYRAPNQQASQRRGKCDLPFSP